MKTETAMVRFITSGTQGVVDAGRGHQGRRVPVSTSGEDARVVMGDRSDHKKDQLALQNVIIEHSVTDCFREIRDQKEGMLRGLCQGGRLFSGRLP